MTTQTRTPFREAVESASLPLFFCVARSSFADDVEFGRLKGWFRTCWSTDTSEISQQIALAAVPESVIMLPMARGWLHGLKRPRRSTTDERSSWDGQPRLLAELSFRSRAMWRTVLTIVVIVASATIEVINAVNKGRKAA